MESEFLFNPTPEKAKGHSAILLESSSGDLLATWYAYPEEECSGGSIALARKAASDKSWSKSKLIFPNSNLSQGNPIMFECPDGKLILMYVILRGHYWNDAELQMATSTDNGYTWSAASMVSPKQGLMVRHSPIITEDQTIIIPAYLEREHESVFLEAQAPYTSWQMKQPFSGYELIQPGIATQTCRSHTLLFRPIDEPKIAWRARSGDDGKNWSDPVRTTLPNPLSGIATFAVGDRIIAVYNHTLEHKRTPLSLAFSDNSGVSWSEPWHFDTVDCELSYPHFIMASDGLIHGVYTYNRRMIKYVCFSPEEIPAWR